MTPFLLTLFTLPSADVSHLALHPPEAFLYAEVPDVPAAFAACEEAPFIRLLRDDAMLALTELLPGDVGLDLGPVLAGLVARSPEVIGSARRVSFSVWGLEEPFLIGGGSTWVADLAALVVVDAADAAGAEALVERHLVLGGWTESAVAVNETIELAGVTSPLRRFVGRGGLRAWCAVREERLFVGLGAADPGDLARRLGEPASGSDPYAAERTVLGPPAGVVVVEGHSRIAPWEGFDPYRLLYSALLPPLAIEGAWRTQRTPDGFLTELCTRKDAAKGADLVLADLATIPADAMAAWAGSVGDGSIASILSVLDAGDAELRGELDAIVGALGTDVVFWVQPLTGMALPRTYLSVGLKDAQAFAERLDALVARLGERPEGELRARSKAYRKVPTWTFELPETGGAMTPGPWMLVSSFLTVSPSVAVFEGRALFSLTRFHLNNELRRRLKGEEPEGRHPIAARAAELEKGARDVVYVDWSIAVSGIYELVKVIGAMLGEEGDFDPGSLPGSEAFTRFLKPTLRWSRDGERGTYTRIESSLGPEILIGLLEAAQGSDVSAPAQDK